MRMREGLRTAEIAAELRRSPLTIKTQLAAIFSKLEVRSRTRVAALLTVGGTRPPGAFDGARRSPSTN